MITKEDARLVYNLYSQIETTEKIINDLEDFVKQQGSRVPDIIDKNYQPYGSITINIPSFESGRFSEKSARVYNISYNAALRVLKNHIEHLKKQIKTLTENIENGIHEQ